MIAKGKDAAPALTESTGGNIDHAVIAQEISKANVAKGDTVILYCRSGHRSGIAQETLKKMGYLRVENYGSIDQARKLLQ